MAMDKPGFYRYIPSCLAPAGQKSLTKLKNVYLVILLVLFGTAALLSVLVSPALAQVPSDIAPILPDIAVRGRGWEQLMQPNELLEFGLALVETSVMTATLAYHPIWNATRRKKADFETPRALFIFALIGMVVGFLIMHHGYLIGFVLFGLGGLLRFKTDENSGDTMRLLLVTLVGLCVGLDLPVVALITTASAWTILYLLGGPANFGIDIQFSDKIKPVSQSMQEIRDELQKSGFRTISMSRTKFKTTVHYVVTGARGSRRSLLEREMVKLAETEGSGISDWHVD